MNEQDLQKAYTRHCEVTGQTNMTRTGFEDFKAGYRLAQPAAGEPVPIGYANPKHLARMAAGGMGSVSVLAERSPDENHTAPVFAAPPAAAHGDEALENAQNDLARTMAWVEKFKGMFGAIADGSAFYLSTAAEGRRRCQGILVRYEQDQAAMRAQGDGGEA